MVQDPHSYANPHDVKVKHLKWTANLDFTNKVIQATAVWEIEVAPDSDVAIFDTKDISISRVWLDEGDSTQSKLGEHDEILGRPLAVMIRPGTKRIGIEYTTSPGAEALQWLESQQTAGKMHPFMFTQSQAILARSWVPCQDSPDIRFTYEATVTCPPDLLTLMSASNPETKNSDGKYSFKMEQPIPSYLLALACGDLAFKQVSGRSGIYAEPALIDKAAWEFADLEKWLQELKNYTALINGNGMMWSSFRRASHSGGWKTRG